MTKGDGLDGGLQMKDEMGDIFRGGSFQLIGTTFVVQICRLHAAEEKVGSGVLPSAQHRRLKEKMAV